MATSEVVGSIFLAADELLRVKELAISASPHFIDHSGLEIHKNSTRDVLPCSSFAEKGVERIISSSNCFVTWHLPIGLKQMQGLSYINRTKGSYFKVIDRNILEIN